MVLLDHLFPRKQPPQQPQKTGPTSQPTDDDQAALDRKIQRLERRELLYAVVRESMARVGVLSSSYKYKVLSLDSRGNQYLIMMDLPQEMADNIGQLAEIEEVVKQNARQRHHIEVTAVYWRIQDMAKAAVLRKPKAEAQAAPVATEAPHDPIISAPVSSRAQRFEPIRPDEVQAFKQALASGKPRGAPSSRPKPASRQDFAPTEFLPSGFEPTRLREDDADRMPLSRTQYGDLI